LVLVAALDLKYVQFDRVTANIMTPRKSLPRVFEFFVEASTMPDDLRKIVK